MALQLILDEWLSARPYDERLHNIRTGSGPFLNPTVRLEGSGLREERGFETVHDDLSRDQLQGNAGQDWFFADLSGLIRDKLLDRSKDEQVND